MNDISWQRYVTLPPSGGAQSQALDIGPAVRSGVSELPPLVRLHLTTVIRAPVPVVAMIALPGGEEIGPVDLPCYLNVPAPVHVTFTVLAAIGDSVRCRATLSSLPDAPNIWGATHTVYPGNANVAIPDAAIGVAVLSGATGTFRDAAANPVGTFTGPYYVARLRGAVLVSVSVPTAPIVFFY
jgi:hypothetical protein